jgi:hypothetical protein
MPSRLDKYFWDSPIDTFSKEYQIVRLLEYASFPDLFAIPFVDMKEALPRIALDRHRIPQSRLLLFKKLLPFIAQSSSLDEAIERYVTAVFAKRGYNLVNWRIS